MLGVIAYIDPGSGFVFGQNLSLLAGIILGFLGIFFFFFKFFFRFLKRYLWLFFILLVISIVCVLIMLQYKGIKNKVIVLGIDAMDPHITEKLIEEGKLTNLAYLKTEGGYSHLSTTVPAESVVAWSSFSTGLNPGGHGIFDFIMRDPKTYLPYLSLNDISNVNGKVKIQIRRKGDSFWNILSQNKIPSFIYFCPNTFPPDRFLGKMVSGMGVPDITGTMGKFSFYTTKELTNDDRDSRGRIIQVQPNKNIISTELYGPKISSSNSTKDTKVPLKIILIPAEKKVLIKLGSNRFFLEKGSWSKWLKISFRIGSFREIHGIVKLYLKSVDTDFELYVSPINFDPQSPFYPVSFPSNYSKYLSKKTGFYHTQGMPHDSWALTEGRLDEKSFLECCDEILNEREKILNRELKEFKGGVFFFYLDTLDIIQHMFWRYGEKQHPLYEENSLYQDIIYKYYEKIDQIVGEVLKNIDKETTLIIFSDHGFSSFNRSVHLNRWLLENKYLFLKEGVDESSEFLENVDWSRTRAYALGFGGIYLNKIGREYYGIVDQAEVSDFKQTIIEKLKQFRDSKTDKLVVKNVYRQEDIFKGPYVNDTFDLFVGFNAGFRASWQTALGGVPRLLIEDNKRKWSGDHLIDPQLVEGVIFVNKKTELREPSIIDIAPTILNSFGITKPNEMQGIVLFYGY